ncbi:MAG: hypothetical protein QHJ81_16465, partial [Anaerolineae bacterium]|nr:hypothetical protein [Anaerolineae bacterium]
GFYQVLVPGGDASEPQAVPVEVGLSDGVYTQIVRGLNEGDQVVVQVQADESSRFGPVFMVGGMGAPPAPPGEQRFRQQ